ncbi:hypothetical protein BDV93DRAFT_566300 [Ceratobasidium sp. AG-I]|nr:hypothetical protein BDV93DRAFT_566300 [Ceratobasidium sp. AG-I]
MPPKSKSKTAQAAIPVVTTRSGRHVMVPERAAFEVFTQTQGRVAHEAKQAIKAIAAEIELQPVEVDPGFIHAMVGLPVHPTRSQDDAEDVEETDQTARLNWLVHTIKLRNGRDYSRNPSLRKLERIWLEGVEAEDDEEDEQIAHMNWLVSTIKLRDGHNYGQNTSLEELKKIWREGAEVDVAVRAAPAKAQAKSVKKAVGKPNPNRYSGANTTQTV